MRHIRFKTTVKSTLIFLVSLFILHQGIHFFSDSEKQNKNISNTSIISNADIESVSIIKVENLEVEPATIQLVMQRNYSEFIKTLNPETVNITTRDGYTPLMLAAIQGDLPMVQSCLNFGAKENATVSAKEWEGSTPLMFSAASGNKSIVELLLQEKNLNQSINTKNKDGLTAILFAAMMGHSHIVDYLKAMGAIDTITEWRSPLNSNLLIWATKYGGVKGLQYLMKFSTISFEGKRNRGGI